MAKKDYFHILGIARDSSPSEVKRAYRRLAFRYHPDTSEGGEEGIERFREVREAYDVLMDEDSRTRHERELDPHHVPVHRSRSGSRTPSGSDARPFEPFSRRGFMGRRGPWGTRFERPRPFPPFGRRSAQDPAVHDLPLTASEARNGTERDLRIFLPYETIRVTVVIPPGVDEGSLLEVVGPRTRERGIRVVLRACIVE
ncbi:MAG: DnaJ domain-containing protein [Deltaproteobacteria bacterium]|nr:DnaJ domain-containing protein [Deltaproteobacteria bacterium]